MTKSTQDRPSKISCDVDLDAEGVQHGHMTIPHSRNDSPWGSLLMPISSFKRGDGPVVLLTGGNHGDEYEGPITLMKLMRSLPLNKINGQVIILPALNYPAVKEGTRLSPLDGGNMNRAFPGDARGNITQMIADFVHRFLISRADAVIDIHAGGKLMTFLPTSVIHNLPDAAHMAATIAAAKAFGAPNCLVLEELDAVGLLDTAVEDQGKLFISTELGGGGSSSQETVSIAENGIHDTLVHLGVLNEMPKGTGETRFLETPGVAYTVAMQSGMFEFTVTLGDHLKRGDLLARIYDIDNPTNPPSEYVAPCDGIVIHRHLAGLIKRGDCLAVMGQETRIFS